MPGFNSMLSSGLLGSMDASSLDAGFMTDADESLASRVRRLVGLVRSFSADTTARLVSLQELTEILSVASEEMAFLSDFAIVIDDGDDGDDDGDGSTPAGFFSAQTDITLLPDMMLLSCRCLSNLFEANPSSVVYIVRHAGVEALVAKLTEIEYIDLAETILAVLAHVAAAYPLAVIRSNGLVASLQYIDFFGVHVQRVAMSIAANACRALGALHSSGLRDAAHSSMNAVSMVLAVSDTITRLLSSSDAKLLSQAVKCVSRMIEWSARVSTQTLEQVATPDLMQAVVSLLRQHASSNNATHSTTTPTAPESSVLGDVLNSVTCMGRGSPRCAIDLTGRLQLLDVVRVMLMHDHGCSAVSSVSSVSDLEVNSAADPLLAETTKGTYSTQQLLELLRVPESLLPLLPEQAPWSLCSAPSSKSTLLDLFNKPPLYDTLKAPVNPSTADTNTDTTSAQLNPIVVAQFTQHLLQIYIQLFSSTVCPIHSMTIMACVAKSIWFAADASTLSLLWSGHGRHAFFNLIFRSLSGFAGKFSDKADVDSYCSSAGNGTPDGDSYSAVCDAVTAVQLIFVMRSRLSQWGAINDLRELDSWLVRHGILGLLCNVSANAKKMMHCLADRDALGSQSGTSIHLNSESTDVGLMIDPAFDAFKKTMCDILVDAADGNDQNYRADQIADWLCDRLNSMTSRIEASTIFVSTTQISANLAGIKSEVPSKTSSTLASGKLSFPRKSIVQSQSEAHIHFGAVNDTASHTEFADALDALYVAVMDNRQRYTAPTCISKSVCRSLSPVFTSINGSLYGLEDACAWLSLSTQSIYTAVSESRQSLGDNGGNTKSMLDDLSSWSQQLCSTSNRVTTHDYVRILGLIAHTLSLHNDSSQLASPSLYEIQQSGLVAALSRFLDTDDSSHTQRLPVPSSLRRQCFMHVFMDGAKPVNMSSVEHLSNDPNDAFVSGAFSALVVLLQSCVSCSERLEIATAVPGKSPSSGPHSVGQPSWRSRSDAATADLNMGAIVDTVKQIRLQIIVDNADRDVLADIHNIVVSIHAVVSVKSLAQFLLSRLGGDLDLLTNAATGSRHSFNSLPATSCSTRVAGTGSTASTNDMESDVVLSRGIIVSAKSTASSDTISSSQSSTDNALAAQFPVSLMLAPSLSNSTQPTSSQPVVSIPARNLTTTMSALPTRSPHSSQASPKPSLHFSIAGSSVNAHGTVFGAIYPQTQRKERPISLNDMWTCIHVVYVRIVHGNDSEPSDVDHGVEALADIESGGSDDTTGSPLWEFVSLLATLHEINTHAGLCADGSDMLLLPEPSSNETKSDKLVLDNGDSSYSIPRQSTPLQTLPSTLFINPRVTAKLSYQMETSPLVAVSNVMPIWCRRVATEYRFLIPLEVRTTYMCMTTFGVSRSLAKWLQIYDSAQRGHDHQVGGNLSDTGDDEGDDILDEVTPVLPTLQTATHMHSGHANSLTNVGGLHPRPAVVATSVSSSSLLTATDIASFGTLPSLPRQSHSDSHILPSARLRVQGDTVGEHYYGERLRSRALPRSTLTLLCRMQRQRVCISRNRIVESMLRLVHVMSTSAPHRAGTSNRNDKKSMAMVSATSVLEIEFNGEVGTGLGPTLEFYALASRELRHSRGVRWPFTDTSATSSTAGSDTVAETLPSRITPGSHSWIRLWRNESVLETVATHHQTETSATYLCPHLGVYPYPMQASCLDSESGRRALHLFRCLGVFIAKALLDSRVLDLHLSSLFLDQVLSGGGSGLERGSGSKGVDLSLVKRVDPQLVSSLTAIADYACAHPLSDLSELAIDMTLPGYPDIPVFASTHPDGILTRDTLDGYVRGVVDLTVGRGVSHQIQAFRHGMRSVMPGFIGCQCVDGDELSEMLGALDTLCWESTVLAECVKADHGYHTDSRIISDLRRMMTQFDHDGRRMFLRFVTGTPRLPIGGFRALRPPLTVVRQMGGERADRYLPSVMTCANYLKVPEYSSFDVLVRQFGVAMREGQSSFHLS
ncbi:hypothetical protein BSLG_003790 [Batrachochytrium salamandrivorans]|nr:hypothetical protein BSLG_003790 [Batrachochytrium salamandrivorans]